MLKKQLRDLLNGPLKTKLIWLLGAAGILLILMSGRKSGKEPSVRTANSGEKNNVSASDYCAELESRLRFMLMRMQGVGEVTVTVTVSSSEEYVFAEEVKSAQSDRSVQQESRIVLTKSNGQETALIASTHSPPVQGVAILCSGGDHASVREAVTSAVGTVLGIPPAKIYVGKTISSD